MNRGFLKNYGTGNGCALGCNMSKMMSTGQAATPPVVESQTEDPGFFSNFGSSLSNIFTGITNAAVTLAPVAITAIDKIDERNARLQAQELAEKQAILNQNIQMQSLELQKRQQALSERSQQIVTRTVETKKEEIFTPKNIAIGLGVIGGVVAFTLILRR